jgi:hypothetical protein
LKFNEEEGQYKAVVKFFKSKESIARFIKTTPKIFDPILPGLVLYGIMESGFQKMNYGGKAFDRIWWFGGLVSSRFSEGVLTTLLKGITASDEMYDIFKTVMQRGDLESHIMRGGGFQSDSESDSDPDSETDPDFDSDVEADYDEDFMFEFQGVHPTSIEEAIIMKENRPATPGPVDESDDEEVDTTVANTSEPWQTDYGNALPMPMTVYGGQRTSAQIKSTPVRSRRVLKCPPARYSKVKVSSTDNGTLGGRVITTVAPIALLCTTLAMALIGSL